MIVVESDREKSVRAEAIRNRRATEVLLRSHGNFDMADMVRDNTDKYERGEAVLRWHGWGGEQP